MLAMTIFQYTYCVAVDSGSTTDRRNMIGE